MRVGPQFEQTSSFLRSKFVPIGNHLKQMKVFLVCYTGGRFKKRDDLN